jgi:uncharacterized protein YjdB
MTVSATAAALLLALPTALVAQNVSEVQVAPPSVTLKVGERTGLLATAFDRGGNVIPTVRVFWSSNNIQVARVDNNGTVTGVANGVAIIVARVGPRQGSAAVQVVGGSAPQPVAQAPPPTPVEPPPSAAPSSAVSLAGQPFGTGPATVLRIEPPTIYLLPSENVHAVPRALKDDGSAAAPVAVTWKSLRPDIASVDPNGTVVALSPGQGTVQATGANGLTATAPVAVQQADIAIQEAAPIALSPGGVDTLHALVPTQGGRLISPLTLQWASSDPSVVRVSLTGVITAVSAGRATLTVAGLLQTKMVEVVVHRPVELLAVRPKWQDEVLVPIQATAKFEATALGADKVAVPEAPLRWTLVDTSLASFDPGSGVLTGKIAGKTQLVVKGPGQGLSVSWTVRVIAGTVKLSATRIGLPLGRRYGAKGSYADDAGAVLGPAAGLTWVSDNPQVASVSDDGMITAVGYGHARVTATAPGGKRGTADVFVQGEIVVASSRSGHFQLYAAERSNLAQLRKITGDTTTASDPAFAADGSRIAFTGIRGGRRDIFVMDADGTNAAPLAGSVGSEGHPQFTPDASAVVFQSDRAGHSQIFMQPLGGSEAVQLTQEPAVNMLPALSPDGETIAFVSMRDGGANIWLMSKDGSNQRAFTRTVGSFRNTAPHFLRDGSLVYLLTGTTSGRSTTQVVKADLVTGRASPLASTDVLVSDFAVSPSGDLLALVVVVVPGGKPLAKVYIQPVGTGGATVPFPALSAEQMVTPAFMP